MTGGTVFFDNVRSGDVGRHQVGSELNALEFQIQSIRDGFDQKRFCQTRDTRNHGMSTHKKRGEHLVDDAILADDLFTDFLKNHIVRSFQLLQNSDIRGCRGFIVAYYAGSDRGCFAVAVHGAC